MFVRKTLLAAGAATLMFAQAAYAAPAQQRVDPLISLSVFGSAQSRAAVCAAGANAAAAAGAAAATAAQAPATGCVLPVVVTPTPVVTEPAPVLTPAVATGGGIGVLPLLLGLAALVGIAAVLFGSDDDGDGNLAPISPA